MNMTYHVFYFKPSSPVELREWLQMNLNEFGFVLIATNGDYFIFREQTDYEATHD